MSLLYKFVHAIALLQFIQSSEQQVPIRNVTTDRLPGFMGMEINAEDGLTTKNWAKSEQLERDHGVTRKEMEDMKQKNVQDYLMEKGSKKPIIDDYFTDQFSSESFPGEFISDTEILLIDGDKVSIKNVETNVITKVMDKKVDESMRTANQYIFAGLSADRQYLMVKISPESIGPHLTKAFYKIVKLTDKGYDFQRSKMLSIHSRTQKIQFASWSPVGHSLISVDTDNNLHYQASPEERAFQITHDGKEGVVFNCERVLKYRYETFEAPYIVKHCEYSPDGKAVLYLKKDYSEVGTISLNYYVDWKPIGSYQYPVIKTMLYTKVGSKLHKTEAWLFQVLPNKEYKQNQILPPKTLGQEIVDPLISWINNETVSLAWRNRYKNHSVTQFCSYRKGVICKNRFIEKEPHGFVSDKLLPTIKSNIHREIPSFLRLVPENIGLRLRKLYLFNGYRGRYRLTKRNAEVVKINGWTSDQTIFYITTGENQPGERYLYKLNLKDCLNEGCKEVCLSCESNIPDEVKLRGPCLYADARVSKDGSYYIVNCLGPNIPYEFIVNATTGQSKLLNDNGKMIKLLHRMSLPKVEYLQLPLKETPVKAHVRIHFPPGVGPLSGTKKYPTLVYIYGGPGHQMVTKEWIPRGGQAINDYMVLSKGVVIIMIDGRGSGYSGENHRFEIYRRLGTPEVEDVNYVMKQLQDMYPSLDATRTGIWGWSYGGFLTLSVLTSSPLFQCGVSVAPVTRWDLYNVAYTEQFMSSLGDNPDGYNNSSPLWKIEGLRDKDLLMVHGSFDTNVHPQNSFLFAKALQEANILFQEMIYTDMNHTMGSYSHKHKHMFRTIVNFFMKGCFSDN